MQNGRIYSFDDFQLDVDNRQLLRHGKPLPLPAKAFDLLQTLLEHNGRLVEKDELFNSVWRDQIVEESNLTVHISQIRKALGETTKNPRYIETVPGYGYRFVGNVSSGADEELVIETETFSQITIEKEEISDPEIQGRNASAFRRLRVSASQMLAVGGAVIVLAAGFGFYNFYGKKSAGPFEKFKLTRLTNSGKVNKVTISPDGKYIAYVLGEPDGNSIWAQQVGTASNILLLPPVKAEILELTFTPDGSHIVYNLFGGDKATPQFFRIPSLGGVSERIQNVVALHIAFAPDGKRIAYAQSDSAARQNYLVIANADGGNQQRIAAKSYPNTFETEVPVVAWSPDGKTIACLVNNLDADATYSSIVGINVEDGTERLLSEQRWYDLYSIEWLKNGGGLLISASSKISGSNQVRFLTYPEGEARQITNDLSSYHSLSATADGGSFVGIQTNQSNGIFVGETGADAGEFEEIVSETGNLHPLVWTPDGKIIFRSNKSGVSNLWTMDADGGNRRQLTTDAQVDGRHLCMPPDGRYLVFGSWRNGRSNIWRVDSDGTNLTQLTNSDGDLYPSCSPDNRTVVYQKGFSTTPTLWKVDIEGGEPVQLTDFYAKWNAISNDDRLISYFFMDKDKWRIGIIDSAGGPVLQRVDVPITANESPVRWSPDGRSLFLISTVGNVGNIRSLPLDGSEPQSMTNFKSHILESFSWSPDGKRLAVARGLSVSDVVLLTDKTEP